MLLSDYCSVHGSNHSHIFELSVCDSEQSATSGVYDFGIPHCAEYSHDEPNYEVRYMRNGEVLGRVTAANESVVPEYTEQDDFSPFDKVGLEHLMTLFAIVATLSFGIAYYVRYKRNGVEYGGLACFSTHDHDDIDDVVMLNSYGSSSAGNINEL